MRHGEMTVTQKCIWNWMGFGGGGNWQAMMVYSSTASNVAVKATGLGQGTLAWDMNQFQGGTWIFTSASGTASVINGSGGFNVFQGSGVQLSFGVNSGGNTGKFAGVSGGSFNPVSSPDVTVPQGECNFCDPPSEPGTPGSVVVVGEPLNATSPFAVGIVGSLQYG